MNKQAIREWLVVLGLFAAVDVVWRVLEIVIYGEVKPCWADTIVGLIFVGSLYANLTLLTKPEKE